MVWFYVHIYFGDVSKKIQVGGVSGFVGTLCLGPRLNRFDVKSQLYKDHYEEFFMGNNVPNQVLGTFILWFAWYSFNCMFFVLLVLLVIWLFL